MPRYLEQYLLPWVISERATSIQPKLVKISALFYFSLNTGRILSYLVNESEQQIQNNYIFLIKYKKMCHILCLIIRGKDCKLQQIIFHFRGNVFLNFWTSKFPRILLRNQAPLFNKSNFLPSTMVTY